MRSPVTGFLLALVLAVHLLGAWFEVRLRGAPPGAALLGDRSMPVLLALGARHHLLVEQGARWRLVGATFLHQGPVHLAFNAVALWGLGRIVEAVFGGARTAGIFLLTALAASVLSQALGTPASVGASGAVFGLLGAGVAFGVVRGRRLPPRLRRFFVRDLLPWVAFNLVMGVVVPGIDNAAHVGGLLAGLLLGAVLAPRLGAARPQPRWGTLSWWLVSAGILSWWLSGFVPAVLRLAGRP